MEQQYGIKSPRFYPLSQPPLFNRTVVSIPETGAHILIRLGFIFDLRMTISKKQLVGISAAVLTVVYSLRRWRRNSANINDNEQPSPSAD